MDILFVEELFKSLKLPVIICKNTQEYPVLYANSAAKLMFNPLIEIDHLKRDDNLFHLSDLLVFQSDNEFEMFLNTLNKTGSIAQQKITLLNHENNPIDATLTANLTANDLSDSYIVFYVGTGKQMGEVSAIKELSKLFYISSHVEQVDDAVNQILAFAGTTIDVSRVYVFEETSPTMTANTYEWCAPGVKPEIQNLQSLKKKDYNYDVIVEGGMYITDDIRDLPKMDREILEAQDIKSIAILPLVHLNKPLGYIGFDDCKDFRRWNTVELDLLENIASVMVTLLARRNSEAQLNHSLEILQTITDNLDSVIYVSDIETEELIFYNNAFKKHAGLLDSNSALGKKCWAIAQENQTGQCDFCPLHDMIDKNGNIVEERLSWEFQNTRNNKWYLVRDAIIKWINGQNVHIETATEITAQKEYSKKMEEYAYIDILTGARNRLWGYKVMTELLASTTEDKEDMSLVFVDINGLKKVNDTFGHDAGDELIVTTAQVMRNTIRKSDTICRWGGDEFLLLLRCNTENAEIIMQKVEKKLDEMSCTKTRPYEMSVSYGITKFFDDKDQTIDHIISEADRLMYEDKLKKQGKK